MSSLSGPRGGELAPPGEPFGWWDLQDTSTLWQDDGRTTPVTASGQNIAVIDDKGSTAGNFTQTTASHRPEWNTAMTGGLGFGFAKMDGSLDHMEITAMGGSGTDFSFTIAAVFNVTSIAAMNSVWFVSNSGQEGPDNIITTGGIWQNWGNGTAHATTALSVDTTYVTWRRGESNNGTARFNWQAGGQIDNDVTNTFLPDYGEPIFMGTRSTGPSQPLNGGVAEYILYDSYISDADIALLETYFASKYGLSWAA